MAPSRRAQKPEQDHLLKRLGPGLITGASDDDPSGMGTYSQAGAQLGLGVSWTMLLTYPLMAAIQEISGRIGAPSSCRQTNESDDDHAAHKMLITILGLLAATMTSLSYIPQVRKALPKGSTDDLSFRTLIILGIGLSLSLWGP